MIERQILPRLKQSLAQFPAVALLGPRRVGKTTLARSLAGEGAVFLDLERPADLARLRDAETYLDTVAGRFVIVDEVQRMPELFPVLRVLIDRNKRPGRFLLLGSASPALRRQSSESLAGRIDYLELAPFSLDEVGATTENLQTLLLRGGFPESFLAPSDKASLRWRNAFIRTFLEQELPQLGFNIPAPALLADAGPPPRTNLERQPGRRRLGTDAADRAPLPGHPGRHLHGAHPAPPCTPGKRLIKSPRVFLRDCGLLHALLGIETLDALFAHPIVGAAWEGMVIEHIVTHAPEHAQPHFYRTVTGAEIDLVLESSAGLRAFDAKFGHAPKPSRGYHQALADLGIACGTVVYSGNETYRMAPDANIVSLPEAIREAGRNT